MVGCEVSPRYIYYAETMMSHNMRGGTAAPSSLRIERRRIHILFLIMHLTSLQVPLVPSTKKKTVLPSPAHHGAKSPVLPVSSPLPNQ